MKIALIIICAIILLIAILLFIPTYVFFDFKKDDKNNDFDIEIKYLFFKIKMNPKKSPGKKKKSKKEDSQKPKKELSLTEKIEKGIMVFKYVEDETTELLVYASKHAVTISNFEFFSEFGLSDAMYTGITTGALYGTVYNVIAFVNKHIAVEKCLVKINPDFEKQHVNIHSKCILRVKNVHIMIIVFKVLKMYFKITKIK